MYDADGEFKASAIADFVSANKLPLVTTLTQETSPSIFGNPIKKQACHVAYNRISFLHSNIVCPCTVPSLRYCPCFASQILLFAVASESSKFLPIFKEAAKPFKGKVILSVC